MFFRSAWFRCAKIIITYIISKIDNECYVYPSKRVIIPRLFPIYHECIHRIWTDNIIKYLGILLTRVGLKHVICCFQCVVEYCQDVQHNFDSFLRVIFVHVGRHEETTWRVGNAAISSNKKWNDMRICVISSNFVQLLKLDDSEFFLSSNYNIIVHVYLHFVCIIVGYLIKNVHGTCIICIWSSK
jgi:hypothetical protein